MGNAVAVKGASGEVARSVFDFEVEDIEGKTISMSQFRGKKAYLMVNVARL